FAHALNILVNTQKNPSITQKIPTTRSLCECELYAPAKYDNDPQMKYVMDNFNKQIQERFEEYDERMKSKRKHYKDRCDKQIQKIILKDKLEKQMAQKLTTLETKLDTNDIPTCICEKSLADKVEKGCLRCGGILGAAMPEFCSIGGSLLSALYAWKPVALKAATEYALSEATKAATQAGINAVKLEIEKFLTHFTGQFYADFSSVVSKTNFRCGSLLHKSAMELLNGSCHFDGKLTTGDFCSTILRGDTTTFVPFAQDGATAYDATFTIQKGTIEAAQEKAIGTTFMGNQTAIIASIVAIVVIVLVMIIIYLILRYRRKKKMKKKLQYVKLLDE
ncbi:rifin, partial [Plasmodium reichenowi]